VFERAAQPILSTTLIFGNTSVLVVLYILADGFTFGIAGVLLVIMYAVGFSGYCSAQWQWPAFDGGERADGRPGQLGVRFRKLQFLCCFRLRDRA